MTEDIKNGFVSLVNQRLSSPFVLSFLVSWVFWNYKAIMVVFSKNTFTETVRLIDEVVYPGWYEHAMYAFVFPAFSAAIYLILQPIVDRFFLSHQWQQRNRTNDRFFQIYKVRTVDAKQSAILTEKLNKLEQSNSKLLADYENEKSSSINRMTRLAEYQERFGEIDSPQNRAVLQFARLVADKCGEHLNRYSDMSSSEMKILYQYFSDDDDFSRREQHKKQPYSFDALVEMGYLIAGEKNTEYSFTEKGKQFLFWYSVRENEDF